MPYPNEHAARIKDPNLFDKKSFRSKEITSGIRIIIGKLEGQENMITQAYRFSADKFTVEEAKAWLKDHKIGYIKFEVAGLDNELKHYGVLGMRWGVRRSKTSDSQDHITYSSIRKKKVRDMSDDELKIVTKRILLLNTYRKSGGLKNPRKMTNDDLTNHYNKFLLRRGILQSPVRKWKIKDFVKTYKMSDSDAKILLDRVRKENIYYTAKNARTMEAARYLNTILSTNINSSRGGNNG